MGEIVKGGLKNTKLGVIPIEWEISKLGEITQKITDGTHKTPKYVDQGIIFISAKNIVNGRIDFSDTKYITHEEHFELIKRCNPERGDILLTKSGSLGVPAIIKTNKVFSLFESLALIKYDREKVFGDYLYQYLSSPIMQKIYQLGTKGLSVKHLHLNEISKFEVILPTYKEQEKIATILSTWDKAIELKENLIIQKKEQKKGLMKKLLTGEIRLPDFNDKWVLVEVGEVLRILKKDSVKEPQNYNLLTVKLHLKGIEATNKKPNATTKGRPYYVREPNELLIGRQNFHNGGIGIVPEDMVNYIASNAISSLEAIKGNLKFYYYYLSNENFYKKVENLIGGTGQKEISESKLVKLKMFIPSNKDEQNAIADLLELFDKEISLLGKELQHLEHEKKGLMQRLLTGEIRVKV